MRKIAYTGFFLLFFVFTIKAQKSVWVANYLEKTAVPKFLHKDYNSSIFAVSFPFLESIGNLDSTTSCLIPDFNSKNLPFFCRIEHHLDKQSNMNFRFRLGTQEVVDQKEGKR